LCTNIPDATCPNVTGVYPGHSVTVGAIFLTVVVVDTEPLGWTWIVMYRIVVRMNLESCCRCYSVTKKVRLWQPQFIWS